jgi:nitroreductase
MDAVELLLSRDSALKLTEPAPSEKELDIMLCSAVRAPDHGRLRPWHFVIVRTDKREAFGEVMADVLRRRQSDATSEMLQRERDKAMRAPLIVVVAARLTEIGRSRRSSRSPRQRPPHRTSCWRPMPKGMAQCGRQVRPLTTPASSRRWASWPVMRSSDFSTSARVWMAQRSHHGPSYKTMCLLGRCEPE